MMPSRCQLIRRIELPPSPQVFLQLALSEQLWQLGDVRRYAPHLVHGQHMGYVGIGLCLAPIHICEGLASSIFHLIAAWNLLDRPWWGEAADFGHLETSKKKRPKLRE